MIKVVIVDDHQLILSGLRQMLAQNPEIHIESTFTDARLALDFLAKDSVDILITDLDMPGYSGIDLIKKVRKTQPTQKIIVLSMIEERSIINRMIKYDVNGYLMKNEVQNELAKAILAVHRGEIYYNKEIRSLLFTDPPEKVRKEDRIPRISAREKEILRLIVYEKTTAQIAGELFISEGTVITHRKHLLAKLGVKNTAGMVRKALELGLID